MAARKGAWIAICAVVGAVFAGAIAEGFGTSHVIALIFAAFGGAMGVAVARYVG